MVKVCVTGAPAVVVPKSVSSVVDGVVSPLLIALPLPIRLMIGTGVIVAVQVTSKVNGLALLSLLAIETVPLKVASDAASHWRSKLVELPTVTGEVGALVSVKPVGTARRREGQGIGAGVGDGKGMGHRRTPTVVEPKSVASVTVGVVSPLLIAMPLPLTPITGMPVTRQVTSKSKLLTLAASLLIVTVPLKLLALFASHWRSKVVVVAGCDRRGG